MTYVKVRPYWVTSNFSLFSSSVPVENSGPCGSSILYRDTNITRVARPSISKNLRFQTSSPAYPKSQQKKMKQTFFRGKHEHLLEDSMSIKRFNSRHKHTGTEWDKGITRPVLEKSRRLEGVWILPVTSCTSYRWSIRVKNINVDPYGYSAKPQYRLRRLHLVAQE